MRRQLPRLPSEPMAIQPLEQAARRAAEEEEHIERAQFYNDMLLETNLQRVDIDTCFLKGCKFPECIIQKSYITDAVFRDCDLSNVHFEDTNFRRVEFHNCKLVGTNFTGAILKHVLMSECLGRYCNFSFAHIQDSLFQTCDFAKMGMTEARLTRILLEGCSLAEAEMLNTPLKDVNLTTNDLQGIRLSGGELQGAIISSLQAVDLIRIFGVSIQD